MLMGRSFFVIACLSVCSGCGSDSDGSGSPGGGKSFGQHGLGSLDELCEGVTNLTGQAILDQRADTLSTTLSYVTASGDRVDPTPLTATMTWPANPVATCYPTYGEGDQILAGPRVAIEGLTLDFSTADGKFDEHLPAKAWLPTLNGTLQFPQLIAVTTRGALQGSWEPFPEYAVKSDTTMGFSTRLSGPTTDTGSGTVSATASPPAELDAAVFRGAFAMAIWP
jgi:hypothetical protein